MFVKRAVDSLVGIGVEAQRMGDLDAAEKALREALVADRNEPRAIRYLGAILAERGEADAAVELFETALERVGAVSPAAVGFYNNYANALRRAERHADAEKLLQELARSEPLRRGRRRDAPRCHARPGLWPEPRCPGRDPFPPRSTGACGNRAATVLGAWLVV